MKTKNLEMMCKSRVQCYKIKDRRVQQSQAMEDVNLITLVSIKVCDELQKDSLLFVQLSFGVVNKRERERERRKTDREGRQRGREREKEREKKTDREGVRETE